MRSKQWPGNFNNIQNRTLCSRATFGGLKPHFLQNISIPKNGYIYIYCSNESNINMFFDNLEVIHTRGPILEETHYYPFGLTMTGISSKAASGIENKKKYNGIEFDNDLDLNLYEAFYRDLDPQTGRFLQIDPKVEGQETESPYSSMANNPILKSDPLGDEPESGQGDPPGIFARAWNAYKGTYVEAGNWIKNTASTLGENAKANWAAGNTIPQQFAKDALANPISLIDGGAELNIVKGALGMEIKVSANLEKSLVKYEVGTADNLLSRSVKGDGLDIHHISQSKPASQVISGYEKSKAPAIALPLAEHKAIPTLKGINTAGSARQQLAKDVKDLRKYTNAPIQSIQQVIDLNKKMFPGSFIKY